MGRQGQSDPRASLLAPVPRPTFDRLWLRDLMPLQRQHLPGWRTLHGAGSSPEALDVQTSRPLTQTERTNWLIPVPKSC